jgi:hypothetical protein
MGGKKERSVLKGICLSSKVGRGRCLKAKDLYTAPKGGAKQNDESSA